MKPSQSPEQDIEEGPRLRRRSFRPIALVFLVLLILGLAWAVTRITVEYYDGYEYLVTSESLRGPDRYYQPKHILLVTWLAAWGGLGEILGFVGSLRFYHAGMVLINVVAQLPLLVLVRRTLPGLPLAIVALLIFSNRIFAHYAPFALGDLLLPGLIATWELAARDVPLETARGTAARVAALTLCLLSRPQIVIIPATRLLLEVIDRPRNALRAVAILGGATIAHLAGATAFTAASTGLAPGHALDAYLEFTLAFSAEVFTFPTNPWWATLYHFVLATSGVTVALVVLGAWPRTHTAHAWASADRGLFTSSSVYLLFLLFGLTAADTRYLTPLMPAWVLLAGKGWLLLERRAHTLAFVSLVAIGLNGTLEIAKFRDPFYASNIHAKISQQVANWAGERTPVFVTPLAALFPDDHVFSIHDNAFYLYSWSRAAHAFHARSRPLELAFVPGFEEKGYPWPNRVRDWLGRDVVAVVPGPAAFRTIDLPDRMQPIYLFRRTDTSIDSGAEEIEMFEIDPNRLAIP